MPPRFRQRLHLNGQSLDDAAKVDLPMELEVVLLSCDSSPALKDDLHFASSRGSVAEAGFEQQLGTRPHDPEDMGLRASIGDVG